MMKALALMFLLLGAFLYAEEPFQGDYDDTAKKVEKKILDQDKIKIDHFKILYNAKDQSIYLEGIAEQFGSYYLAGKIASEFKGIKKVDNRMLVRDKEVSDIQLQSDLIGRAMRYLPSDPFNLISLRVNHGFVTLLGVVRDPHIKEQVFNDAIWAEGVRSVDNKIQLAQASTSDDRIRVAVFNKLSTDFPEYFRGAHPSIVILVDHGIVTLVGNVNSAADKQRMSSSIRSFFGVLRVVDQLQVE